MMAITITPGSVGVELQNFPEPELLTPTQVKIQILEVEICGTDREEAMGGRADAPPESPCLIIGHEMFGKVVDVGENVATVSIGNLSVLCYTGEYKERGIKGLHGFEAEFVVDEEQYVVKVPESIRSIGVLAEPMSIAEKAIEEAISLQRFRIPEVSQNWIEGKRTLVVGIGAIGILAAVALRLRGAEVIGMDIVGENTKRPEILRKIRGRYIDGREIKVKI